MFKHRLRMFVAATAASLLPAVGLAGAPTASAAVTPHCVPVGTNAVNSLAASLTKSGASHAAISTALHRTFGVTEVATTQPQTVRPLDSSSNYVNIGTPTWYYDSCAGGYYLTVGWSWNNFAGLNTGYHDDGFAVYFNTSVRITGKALSYWGNNGGNGSLGNANSQDSYGLGYAFDVNFDGSNYQGAGGLLTVYADRAGSCANTWGTAVYSHGWSGTTLNSWTISTTGGSANYSSNSSKWQAYGNSGGAHDLC